MENRRRGILMIRFLICVAARGRLGESQGVGEAQSYRDISSGPLMFLPSLGPRAVETRLFPRPSNSPRLLSKRPSTDAALFFTLLLRITELQDLIPQDLPLKKGKCCLSIHQSGYVVPSIRPPLFDPSLSSTSLPPLTTTHLNPAPPQPSLTQPQMSSSSGMQKTIVLRQRPTDRIDPTFGSPTSTFAIVPQPIPTLKDLKEGEVVVRVEYSGVEPSQRVWMSEARRWVLRCTRRKEGGTSSS